MAVKGKRSRAQRKVKPLRARATKGPRAKSTVRDPLDGLIAAAAHALALPIEPAWKPAIKFNLEVNLRLAGSFADFPLPDDAEPAPVFVA
jgi:hypothetical protein